MLIKDKMNKSTWRDLHIQLRTCSWPRNQVSSLTLAMIQFLPSKSVENRIKLYLFPSPISSLCQQMSHLMSILSKDRLSEMLVCQQRARPENASHPGRDYMCHTWGFFGFFCNISYPKMNFLVILDGWLSFLSHIYFRLFCLSGLVFLYYLVHTSQAINVPHTHLCPLRRYLALICISMWLSREIHPAGRRTMFRTSADHKLNIIPELLTTSTFCKANTICLMFNELSLCRLMCNSLCNHSLKCIMSY